MGPPGATGPGGAEIRFSTQKSLALLAMVAVAPEGLRRDQAAARLWSRSPEGQARTNLRQALSAVRSACGGENVILSDGDVLLLNHDLVRLDVPSGGGVFLDEPP